MWIFLRTYSIVVDLILRNYDYPMHRHENLSKDSDDSKINWTPDCIRYMAYFILLKTTNLINK